MTAFIAQALIALTSCVSIWLLAGCGSRQRWGFVVGLAGQPFWFFAAVSTGQWGLFIVTCWFTFSYVRGIWNFWLNGGRL